MFLYVFSFYLGILYPGQNVPIRQNENRATQLEECDSITGRSFITTKLIERSSITIKLPGPRRPNDVGESLRRKMTIANRLHLVICLK